MGYRVRYNEGQKGCGGSHVGHLIMGIIGTIIPIFGFGMPLLGVASFLFFVKPVFPDQDPRIVPLDEDLYRYLRGMSLEVGVLPPSSSLPYPMVEVENELRRIVPRKVENYSGASQAAREAVTRYLSRKPFYAEEAIKKALAATQDGREIPLNDTGAFKGGSGNLRDVSEGLTSSLPYMGGSGFAFYPDLRINAEGYLHTNREYERWVYGFQDREPFMGLLLDSVFFDSLSLYIDVTVQKDPFQAGGDPDNYTNLLTNPSQFDLNMPYRAGMSVGDRHWNIWLGRDRLSWGNGRTGNLLLSDVDLYHEGLRFTSFWERFKFTFLLLGLESWRLETDEQGNPYPWPDSGTQDSSDSDTPDPERFKMFLAHRMEFSLRSNLRLTLNESIVYGGKYPDLRVFNPLIVYHNLYLKEWANSLMTVELDWVPLPGVYLYGQYAQDQLSTLFEKDTYGKDEEPNAMGYLVGIELQRAVGGGRKGRNEEVPGKAWLRGGYEFVKTDPWLYIRETPYVSFFSTRRVHSEARKTVLGEKNYYYLHTPLGYLYGPDVVVNTFWITFEVPEVYRLFLEYSLVWKGENEVTTRFQTGDAAWDLHTPSGTHEVRNILTFGVYYVISPKVVVLMQPSFVYNRNLSHDAGRRAIDFQLVWGIRYRER